MGQSDRHGVSARRRVLVSAGLGACVGLAAPLLVPWPLVPVVAWDTTAASFLCQVWFIVWSLDAEQTARHAAREDPTRTAADGLLVGAALASLVAVGYLMLRAHSSGGVVAGLLGVASVVLSWAVIHTVFTLRYASIYYTQEHGGVTFHQQADPRYSDFAYLAFTVGMTFQVSDPELNTSAIRAAVLRHSLLSYLFGTLIMALTINLVAGITQ